MNHEERIKQLEGQLESEEEKIKALFLTAKIPTSEDYVERDRIRKELKTARRVKAWDEKRTDPKLTRKITIMLSDEEHKELSRKAEEQGVDLSKYIRKLLKSGG